MRRATLALTLMLSALAAPTASHATTVIRSPETFTVTNPQDGSTLTVRGGLFKRDDQNACMSSVMLLVHGLSYGEYAWDFPDVNGKSYSVARALAAAGYPVVAIDLPGYGASSKPSGYSLTVESYAAMVGQITDTLRSAYGFAHVGLMGHSAGTEISELAVGLGLAKADTLIATAYTHVPSQRIATDFFTGDYIRAAQDDYEYFGGDEAGRTEYMYNDNADQDVIDYDNDHYAMTPSGEIYSIGPQPSKLVMANISAPVLLVLAEDDLLFPSEFAEEELALFAGSADAELHVVENAGHSFMLHRNAVATNTAMLAWLGDHSDAIPAC